MAIFKAYKNSHLFPPLRKSQDLTDAMLGQVQSVATSPTTENEIKI